MDSHHHDRHGLTGCGQRRGGALSPAAIRGRTRDSGRADADASREPGARPPCAGPAARLNHAGTGEGRKTTDPPPKRPATAIAPRFGKTAPLQTRRHPVEARPLASPRLRTKPRNHLHSRGPTHYGTTPSTPPTTRQSGTKTRPANDRNGFQGHASTSGRMSPSWLGSKLSMS